MTISHDFISDLGAHRDELYSRALAIASADPQAVGLRPSAIHSRAEVILQSAVRETFAQFEKDPSSHLDPFEAVQEHLPLLPATQNWVGEGWGAMPADIWARLVAAIQIEAAHSTHSKAINPSSVLLDPLLAPKKPAAPDDLEGLGLLPEYRFFLVAAIAILIAIFLTIYLLTRSPAANHADAPEPPPTTSPDTETR